MNRPPLTKRPSAWPVGLAALLVSGAAGCGDPPTEVQPEGMSLPAWGERLFYQKGCAACHDLNGQRRDGPPVRSEWGGEVLLEGDLTARFDEAYIRRAIHTPSAEIVRGYPPVMPSYSGTVTEHQVDAIVAFLRSRATRRSSEP